MANQIPIIISAGRQQQIPNADNLLVRGIVVSPGTITANRPALNHTVVWNNAVIDFEVVTINVTNTDSGALSTVIKVIVDSGITFLVTTNGDIFGNSIEVTTGFIPQLNNLPTNGLIKTINSDGTLDVETRIRKGYFWFRSCV